MFKHPLVVVVLVLTHVLSSMAGYQYHQHRIESEVKKFLESAHNAPSPEAFFNITDANDKK